MMADLHEGQLVRLGSGPSVGLDRIGVVESVWGTECSVVFPDVSYWGFSTKRFSPATTHDLASALSTEIAALRLRLQRCGLRVSEMLLEVWRSQNRVGFMPILGPEDRRLVEKWRGPQKDAGETLDRLESARRAEKAALTYFRNLGVRVTDVSIGQLDRGQSDWTTHDIVVDGQPVDVKNIRFANSRRFGEFLWRDHKVDRSGVPVMIVGVASMVGDAQQAIVVGAIGQGGLANLALYIEGYAESMGLSFTTSGTASSIKVPGWAFEYPAAHCRLSRQEVLTFVRKWQEVAESLYLPVGPWARGLLATDRGGPKDSSETSIVREMSSWFSGVEATRSSVYWFTALWMLGAAREGEVDGIRETMLRYLYLPGDRERRFPLGLDDPRRYVAALVDTLSELIRYSPETMSGLAEFQLLGWNILRARLAEGWVTVLAYCGGCGHWPLVWSGGREAWDARSEQASTPGCQTCPCERSRLVCHECGSCGFEGCGGWEFGSREEADEVARRYPGRAIRRVGIGGYTVDPPEPLYRSIVEGMLEPIDEREDRL